MDSAKFALIVVDIPNPAKYHPSSSAGANINTWQRFQSSTPRRSDTTKGIEMLAENVWLLRLDTGMIALSSIFAAADEGGIAIRVLFLGDTPKWLEYPAHAPKTL
jgi:hypothetical protein